MELKEGTYRISGVDVLQLCQEYDTPLYVYDTARMEAQYKRLTKAFKGTRHKINYACKALSNINVLRFFKQIGSGLDTVSIQEVQLGLKAGFAPHDIIYTPNGVSIDEIKRLWSLE